MSIETVFIIGSGASEEAKIQTASELKRSIAYLLDMKFRFDEQLHGDYLIWGALKEHVRRSGEPVKNLTLYSRAAQHINRAMPQAGSIDQFIDTNPNNDKIALCGKLAIVRAILGAEKNSLLYCEQSNLSNMNFVALEKTWYKPFFELLTENCSKETIGERLKSITLIIFNYDRCVEHFICHALSNFYDLGAGEVTELFKNINIYHPYGTVGNLPWMGQSAAMAFGAEPNLNQLLELSQKIKTFTEGTDPESSNILEIRNHMRIAKRIVFLGFAFHKLNMLLLTPEPIGDTDNPNLNCFATALNISMSDRAIIEDQIQDLYQCMRTVRVEMVRQKCNAFFTEFWRSLSF